MPRYLSQSLAASLLLPSRVGRESAQAAIERIGLYLNLRRDTTEKNLPAAPSALFIVTQRLDEDDSARSSPVAKSGAETGSQQGKVCVL
ncbi:uncharacterized protein P884DRAFT_259311 [Thermothelomyces heterothallicus CBS 202.75]|uniref:uncharacterized protein n=1 Tax=Thermothelomyces heterothallicus CBS 202.75 TaxID=1149848 RepID=UPI003743CE7A